MTLADTLIPRMPPLRQESEGTIYVGSTRVTLDTIVQAYENGASAEEITLAYDSVSLADVHAVISFYLQNRDSVREYLREREKDSALITKQFPPKESWQVLRQRLLARKHNQGQG